jgi:hypothetical protein
MTLGELKKSLNRFSGDFDDAQVIMITQTVEGEDNFDNLAFVGYLPEETIGQMCVVLGSMEVAVDYIKQGRLHNPDGTKPSDTSIDLS